MFGKNTLLCVLKSENLNTIAKAPTKTGKAPDKSGCTALECFTAQGSCTRSEISG